jgi:hypothetical protein
MQVGPPSSRPIIYRCPLTGACPVRIATAIFSWCLLNLSRSSALSLHGLPIKSLPCLWPGKSLLLLAEFSEEAKEQAASIKCRNSFLRNFQEGPAKWIYICDSSINLLSSKICFPQSGNWMSFCTTRRHLPQLKVLAPFQSSTGDPGRLDNMAICMSSKRLHSCSQGPSTGLPNFNWLQM